MGDNIRKYDATVPPQAATDLDTVTLKLAQVSRDEAKRGKFVVTLSNEVRAPHLSDVVHSADWKRLITDFDKKSLDPKIASGFLCV